MHIYIYIYTYIYIHIYIYIPLHTLVRKRCFQGLDICIYVNMFAIVCIPHEKLLEIQRVSTPVHRKLAHIVPGSRVSGTNPEGNLVN